METWEFAKAFFHLKHVEIIVKHRVASCDYKYESIAIFL